MTNRELKFRYDEMVKQWNQMIYANKKLVDDKAEMLKDIKILLEYIKGYSELQAQVNEINEYYDKKVVKG